MSLPNSSFHREAVIFMNRAQQHNSSRISISEDEFYAMPVNSPMPGIWDGLVLTLGDWLITLGSDLKNHSAYTKLSEKQV